MKKVLLTGSSGWLGRFLAPMLRDAGYAVLGLDAAPGQHTDVVGSVADRRLVDGLFAGHRFHAVIHAAALHKPDIARFARQAFIDTNVTGTLNLLEAASSADVNRFVFTSTTSLMISQALRDGEHARGQAVWLDESSGPLEPRNIYGVTKLAAEGLCRLHNLERGMNCVVLRTGRFFPEDDDTLRGLDGLNLKANEFLHRRLTVEDAARAHIVAMEKAPVLGFDLFVLSAPTPFTRSDCEELQRDAAAVVRRCFPDAADLYAARGWRLPERIGRVYDSARAQDVLGLRFDTSFGTVLDALRRGGPLPFAHDPSYVSPLVSPVR
jgi:nucleoside-diphosphate-sugar epimerase